MLNSAKTKPLRPKFAQTWTNTQIKLRQLENYQNQIIMMIIIIIIINIIITIIHIITTIIHADIDHV